MFNTFVNTFPGLSSETLHKIELYYAILEKWNRSHNLVQRNTLSPNEFEMRHLIDCWQLVSYYSKSEPILDIGSGAGLPGILLSIAGFDVHLCEIDQNKMAFLKSCKAQLGLNCMTKAIDAHLIDEKYSQISSRAFSHLSNLLKIQWNVSRETKGIYLKGEHYQKEISEAEVNWDFNLLKNESKSSSQGVILTITALKPKSIVSRETIKADDTEIL